MQHFNGYLSEADALKVLRCYQKPIARFIHVQMQKHYFEEAICYEVKVSKGFTELKSSAYTSSAQEPLADFRVAPADRRNMAEYLFGGFAKCLYSVQKFDSDAERKLAMILERDAIKWFKPAKGQFQIFYRQDADHAEYQPDFIGEAAGAIYMLEPKMRRELDDPEVRAKREAAERWCENTTQHALANGGKPWKYVMIPHDAIVENMTLEGLVSRFG